jgi:hypothetical protein
MLGDIVWMKVVDGEVILYEDPSMDWVWERVKADLLAEGYDLDDPRARHALLQLAFDDEDEEEVGDEQQA